MHGSVGDWSKPRRSSKSKKKLQPCWESHWRRQTATTRHDGRGHHPGACVRSDRRSLRGPERVACQHLPPSRPSGPAAEHAVAPDQARSARCPSRNATPCSIFCAHRASPTRRPPKRLCQPARRGCLPLLDPHHVPHHGRKPRSPRAPRSTAPSNLQETGAAGASATRYGPGT